MAGVKSGLGVPGSSAGGRIARNSLPSRGSCLASWFMKTAGLWHAVGSRVLARLGSFLEGHSGVMGAHAYSIQAEEG